MVFLVFNMQLITAVPLKQSWLGQMWEQIKSQTCTENFSPQPQKHIYS